MSGRPRVDRSRIRIATVYHRRPDDGTRNGRIDEIQWMRISEGLATRGYQVDVIIGPHGPVREVGPRLRHVPYSAVEWTPYDVITTFFHRGFATLLETSAAAHPFIISQLGSVVGESDATPGVYFFGEERQWLHDVQTEIGRRSRYVAVMTVPSRKLFEQQHGRSRDMLLAPTGVDRSIPAPRHNPYTEFSERIAVFIGNIYGGSQKETNLRWQDRLNAVGGQLRSRRIRLCLIGSGGVERLDPACVTYLGVVQNERIWDYQYFADVGIVLAQGPIQHNESSKLYYYLRTGLPVVSEAPVPNNFLIEDSGLGVIAPYGDDHLFTEMVEATAARTWDRDAAIRYVVDNHTWDHRVRVYDDVVAGGLV